MKKVSYCSVCYGRLWQLAFTLQENLKNLKEDEELILVDYNSPDDTTIFILATKFFTKYIEEGKFKFIKVLDTNKFHCPKAKNIAHRFGEGQILVNLDVDNFLIKMREKIDQAFNNDTNSILHMHTGILGGSFGRIALSRDNFYKLGGYDEELEPHSHQDTDLINRAKAMNLNYVLNPIYTDVIANNLYAKNRYLSEDWFIMREKNRKISEENINNNRLIANKKNGWGKCKVIINNDLNPKNFDCIFP